MVRRHRAMKGALGRIVPAFSLIEIVVALGIISFAIVGIMGLFPVAMRAAQESQRETRAAAIAQQIFSDLESTSGTNRFILTGSGGERSNINIAIAATNTPHEIYFSDAGAVQTNVGPNSLFIAHLYVTPDSPRAGMSRVEALIQAPSVAAVSNRMKYSFVTLLNIN